MKVKRICKLMFYRKMNDLIPNIQYQIEQYLMVNKNRIDHFEFGHDKELHIRIYKIVLKNGFTKTWRVSKTL